MTTTRRALGTGPETEQRLPEERQEQLLQPRLLPAERVADDGGAVESLEGIEGGPVRRVRSGRRLLGRRGA